MTASDSSTATPLEALLASFAKLRAEQQERRRSGRHDLVTELGHRIVRVQLQIAEIERDAAIAHIHAHECAECGWWNCHGHKASCSKNQRPL